MAQMSSFSFRKLFLDVLVLVCLVVAGISGYRLFYEHSVDIVWGITVFLVSIGVLIWNASLLRSSKLAYKRPSFKLFFFLLLGVFLVLAFAGVQPLASYKDAAIDEVGSWVEKGQEIAEVSLADYDVKIYPGSSAAFTSPYRNDTAWFVSLDGGSLKGSTLEVELSITNTTNHRAILGSYSNPISPGPVIVAVDSTNKLFRHEEQYVFGMGEMPFYDGEYWPGETRSGHLTFEVSLYSGRIDLYAKHLSSVLSRHLFKVCVVPKR